MDAEKLMSIVGTAILSVVIGAFVSFECPEMIRVPKVEVLSIVKKPKAERI